MPLLLSQSLREYEQLLFTPGRQAAVVSQHPTSAASEVAS
jgi:hypothetical protein